MEFTGTYYWKEEERSYNYTAKLTASQKASFISTLMALLFGESADGTELYLEILYDLLFDYTIVMVATDIENRDIMFEDEDGNVLFSYDTIEEFLNETLIANTVKLAMSEDDLFALRDGVESALAYRTGINKNELGYALGHLLRTVENLIGDYDIESLANLGEELLDIAPTLSEEKIVDAYIEKTLRNNGEANEDQVTIDEVLAEDSGKEEAE